MRWLGSISDSMDMNLSNSGGQRSMALQSMHEVSKRQDLSTKQNQLWQM